MQDDVFFVTSKIQSFQLLDWYMAAAVAQAVAVYNSESKITKDAKNRENFASCMNLMNDGDIYQEEVQSITIQLALRVFHKRKQMSGQTLQAFFDILIKNSCSKISKPLEVAVITE
uniref:Uncharacterized protein n=1 Tax=Romanomermis culicivorax TaxID=13658 RepID=A0A915JKN7_ROMCU